MTISTYEFLKCFPTEVLGLKMDAPLRCPQ
jgi:hypothetical protein